MKEIIAYISDNGVIFNNKNEAIAHDKERELCRVMGFISASPVTYYPNELVSLIITKRKEILNILKSIED